MPAGRVQQVLRISLILCAMYALLAARLYHVQVTESEKLARHQRSAQTRSRYKIGKSLFERPPRGSIEDRNGRLLAVGFDRYRLLMDLLPGHRPFDGSEPLDIAGRVDVLCDVLDDLGIAHDRRRLHERTASRFRLIETTDGRMVKRPRRGVVLVKGLLPHARAHIRRVMKDRQIVNFAFEAEATRRYPQGDLTAELIGYVGHGAKPGSGVRGRAGVEAALDLLLDSRRGRFLCEKDGWGEEFEVESGWLEAPREAHDVTLTIDVQLQRLVDRELKSAIERTGATGGVGIVLDSRTAEILAMRSRPVASLAALRSGDLAPEDFVCVAAQHIFEPGSTIKPLVMARAIQDGFVGWEDRFDTNGGTRRFTHGRLARLVTDSTPHDVLTATDVIVHSSNIGMAMIGHERMGFSRLMEAVEGLGLRERIGIRLPGVPRGRLPRRDHPRPFYPAVSIPFGHQVAMTPLALTARFNVFATGGVYREPRLVARVRNGESVHENPLRERRLIDARISDRMLDVLEQTVERGTAKALRDLDWHVAAKTGTAQRLPYSIRAFNSSVVAIAPVADPRVTVYVCLFDLRGTVVTGGSTAGPAVREIIRGCLEYLGVPGDRES